MQREHRGRTGPPSFPYRLCGQLERRAVSGQAAPRLASSRRGSRSRFGKPLVSRRRSAKVIIWENGSPATARCVRGTGALAASGLSGQPWHCSYCSTWCAPDSQARFVSRDNEDSSARVTELRKGIFIVNPRPSLRPVCAFSPCIALPPMTVKIAPCEARLAGPRCTPTCTAIATPSRWPRTEES